MKQCGCRHVCGFGCSNLLKDSAFQTNVVPGRAADTELNSEAIDFRPASELFRPILLLMERCCDLKKVNERIGLKSSTQLASRAIVIIRSAVSLLSYSYRSATIGSTRAALLAGIQHASAPVASNNETVLASVNGS